MKKATTICCWFVLLYFLPGEEACAVERLVFPRAIYALRSVKKHNKLLAGYVRKGKAKELVFYLE